MSLFMTCFMLIACFAGIYNAVTAYRNDNRDASFAWAVSTVFALALFLRNLADVVKTMA